MKPHTIAMANEPITVLGERSESGHREETERGGSESEKNVERLRYLSGANFELYSLIKPGINKKGAPKKPGRLTTITKNPSNLS